MVAIILAAPYSHRINYRNGARPNGRICRRLVQLGDHAINKYREFRPVAA